MTTITTTMTTTRTTPRAAGLGLIAYAIGTTAGFVGVAAPGGDYQADTVVSFMASSHMWPAFAFGYLGVLSALGLLLFGQAARSLWPGTGETLWGLSIAATAIAVVGGFVSTGVVVAFAEGGASVRGGVPREVVYVLGEVGNLLALCGPAFFMGVAAIILAIKGGLPRWLKVWAVAAGVSGVLLPFFFVIPIYLLWVAGFGVWLAVRSSQPVADPAVPHASVV